MIFTGEKKNKIKRRVVAMVLCICMVVALAVHQALVCMLLEKTWEVLMKMA